MEESPLRNVEVWCSNSRHVMVETNSTGLGLPFLVIGSRASHLPFQACNRLSCKMEQL
jgi:hypothetical protein